MKLSRPTERDPHVSATERTLANVLYTANWISHHLSEAIGPFGITLAQYNVLMTLNESDPKRLTCGALGERLLERTPDLTRLLDRLESRELIVRARGTRDKRVVEVGLTDNAKRLLTQCEEPIGRVVRVLTRGLSIDERRQVSQLLERMRA